MKTVRMRISPDGSVFAVYSDPLHQVGKRLGDQTITRASNVEYAHGENAWVAELNTADATKIASGSSRDQVIRDEVAYLEKDLAAQQKCHEQRIASLP